MIFTGAYHGREVARLPKPGRNLFQMFAMLPMAIPGMVLGLAYIFFFNNPPIR